MRNAVMGMGLFTCATALYLCYLILRSFLAGRRLKLSIVRNRPASMGHLTSMPFHGISGVGVRSSSKWLRYIESDIDDDDPEIRARKIDVRLATRRVAYVSITTLSIVIAFPLVLALIVYVSK